MLLYLDDSDGVFYHDPIQANNVCTQVQAWKHVPVGLGAVAKFGYVKTIEPYMCPGRNSNRNSFWSPTLAQAQNNFSKAVGGQKLLQNCQ